MAALQRQQLKTLCSSSETFEKAQSILRLATARTRPGSGFVVKNSVALPAVCAYLASEQLNTGEVSLQSAKASACVSQAEFSDILKKVRAALGDEEGDAKTHVTYQALVDAYHVYPRDDVIACMEDAEGGLPRVDMLKERYGVNLVSCAVFYWVCQLIEEPSVQERPFRLAYSLPPTTFKAVVTALDKQCDDVANQIKTYLLGKRSAVPSSLSQLHQSSKPTSPQKSPTKSAIRPQGKKLLTPMTTPSRKRTVAFSNLLSEGHDDNVAFPETPTKKRRVTVLSTEPTSFGRSPTKRSSSTATTAAFHAALKGSPVKPSIVQQNESPAMASPTPVAGPSTPRRPRQAAASEAVTMLMQTDSQSSPSRSQGHPSPVRPPVRRRFRPVFLDQQQWYARDPKVEQMWASANTLWNEMVQTHGRPFQGTLQT